MSKYRNLIENLLLEYNKYRVHTVNTIPNLPNEEWKDIPDFEGKYQISNMGRVKSLPRYTITKDRFGNDMVKFIQERILIPTFNNTKSAPTVVLRDNNNKLQSLPIHRLVAKAFIPNPYNHDDVLHLNKNKEDNRAINLKWLPHTNHHNDIIKIKCVETNQIFHNIEDAANWANTSTFSLQRHLLNKKDNINGYHFIYI